MRVDVKKFLFVGILEDKAPFFSAAQHLGVIHFIERRGTKLVVEPENNISQAIKVIRSFPPLEQEDVEDDFLADAIADGINALKRELEERLEEVRVLGLEVARIAPFGDFSVEDIAYIEKEGKLRFRYFTTRSSYREKEETVFPSSTFYLGSESGLDYFVALDDGQQDYTGMSEIYIEKPVGVLRDERQTAVVRAKEIEKNLHEQAKFSRFLHHAYLLKLNTFILEMTRQQTSLELEERLFSIQGWVPVNEIEQVRELCRQWGVHLEEVAIAADDTIPTHLENEGMAQVGQDIVSIYDTPSYRDKDPSLWVLGAFALFFGMIVGDAGYGAVYLCLAFYLGYKFPNLTGVPKRALKLMKILSISCIIWGVMTTSFFGMSVDVENPLRKLSLIHWLAEKKADYHHQHQDAVFKEWMVQYPEVKNAQNGAEVVLKGFKTSADGDRYYKLLDDLSRSVLIEIALVVGMIHIILSFLRYIRRNWSGAGWILAIIGGYLYFSNFLKASSIPYYVFGLPPDRGATEGLYMMVGGISLAVIISIIYNKLTGIFELMNAVQVFADIMSYVRLYALGLAGAIVGATINQMAGALPMVVAVFLIVIAHMINMGLGIMSGIIHGLRLNFLEWYHYSFEGGGKVFRPLKYLDRD